jgi:hypothetical protein
LRTAPRSDGDLTVWLGLPVEAGADRLALQLARLTEVVDVEVVPVASGRRAVRVRRVDVTSTSAGARDRHEAVVALEIDGSRRLGAGEAADRAEAVARATVAAMGLAPAAPAPQRPLVVQRPGGWLAVVDAPSADPAAASGDDGGARPGTAGAVDAREGWAVARATLDAVTAVDGRPLDLGAATVDRTA